MPDTIDLGLEDLIPCNFIHLTIFLNDSLEILTSLINSVKSSLVIDGVSYGFSNLPFSKLIRRCSISNSGDLEYSAY